MANKQTYSVSNIKQLIDLNGDSTNFECNFKITSQNKEPFDMVVMDQTTLDATPTLEYQHADGEISGILAQNENKYRNFFIVLRSEKPCICEVEIDKKVLPIRVEPPKPIVQNRSLDYNNLFYIAIAVIAVGVIVYYGYNYLKNKKEKSKSSSVFNFPNGDEENGDENFQNSEILDRLKNLNI